MSFINDELCFAKTKEFFYNINKSLDGTHITLHDVDRLDTDKDGLCSRFGRRVRISKGGQGVMKRIDVVVKERDLVGYYMLPQH